MSVAKRDEHTGHMSTGHEWNGITELNTPVPVAIWIFFALAFIVSIIYWVLLPAWPTGEDYTRGVLKTDQKIQVDAILKDAAAAQAGWQEAMKAMSYAQISQDPALKAIAVESAHRIFGDSCAGCHGNLGQGGPGYPQLNDSYWLKGNDPAYLESVIAYGINAQHPKTNRSVMPAFGATGVLNVTQVAALATYVRSLSDPENVRGERRPESVLTTGEEKFSGLCAACHGGQGQGNPVVGAPNLADAAWIYGGELEDITQSILHGRQGHMPAWESRLSALDRKMLVIYLLNLPSGDAAPEVR